MRFGGIDIIAIVVLLPLYRVGLSINTYITYLLQCSAVQYLSNSSHTDHKPPLKQTLSGPSAFFSLFSSLQKKKNRDFRLC